MSDRTKEVRERIEFLWLAGWKSESIAHEIGVSRPVIVRHVAKMGLPVRLPSNRDRKNMWRLIFRWLRAGWSVEEVKRGLGYRKIA